MPPMCEIVGLYDEVKKCVGFSPYWATFATTLSPYVPDNSISYPLPRRIIYTLCVALAPTNKK